MCLYWAIYLAMNFACNHYVGYFMRWLFCCVCMYTTTTRYINSVCWDFFYDV